MQLKEKLIGLLIRPEIDKVVHVLVIFVSMTIVTFGAVLDDNLVGGIGLALTVGYAAGFVFGYVRGLYQV